MDPKKTLYLIDGSSYIYRAFYALGRLTNSRGLPTQAVYGFCQMLLKVMREKRPDYLCVVFDPPGPTHRHEMYTAYKANRQKMPEDLVVQVPYIKDLVRYHGVAQLEQEGYEADDVIATLTRWAVDYDLDVVIVSGDKDLIQLVNDPWVRLWDPKRDRILTEAAVAEHFGISPDQMVDYLALVGDSTDNIPGVKGVGEKTARQLLQNWKSLHEIYGHLDEISPASLRAKLQANQNAAQLSRILATLKNDMPISAHPEDFTPKPPQRQDLLRLYGELDFRKLLEAVRQESGTNEELAPFGESISPAEMKIVTDQETLTELVGLIDEHRKIALCLDSSAPDPMRASLKGIAISMEAHTAFYVPFCALDQNDPTAPAPALVLDPLRRLLGRRDIAKIGHDLKKDWMILKKLGIELEGIAFDTMVASYLLHPGQNSHNLARLTGEHLGEATDMPSLPSASQTCQSADHIWRLFPLLESKLQDTGQVELFFSLEVPLIRVLSRMECRGILVDAGKLESLAVDFEAAMSQEAHMIYELAREEFNIQSPKQLASVLFEKLGLPVVKKSKSGPSTDSSVLEELAAVHPIAEKILTYRTLAKLKGTYADVLPRLIHPETGRIHTSFNQTITSTGRLSSSEPNLQNIPIRSEEGRKIREAFIPSPGHLFLSADYSQIELRILAHLSQDERLLDAFHSDGDIHRQTAAEMYNIPQHEVTPEMRRQAKTINFGIIYGMGAFGLARRLGVSRQMAKEMIEHYFRRYEGVRSYIDRVIETARKLGYTETLLGRRRPIPELSSRNLAVRQQGERLAINSPIQGSAADLIKKAMIDVDEGLAKHGLSATMVLQVHDELVLEVSAAELEVTKELIRKKMERVWELSVPVKVDLGWGGNWAQAHS
jgi:DNA polymerase-1